MTTTNTKAELVAAMNQALAQFKTELAKAYKDDFGHDLMCATESVLSKAGRFESFGGSDDGETYEVLRGCSNEVVLRFDVYATRKAGRVVEVK